MIKKLLLLSFTVYFNAAAIAQLPTIIMTGSTDFEHNASMAEIDSSSTNVWQTGPPQKMFFGTSYSAPYAIMTDTLNAYPVNNSSTFTISLDSCPYGFIPNAEIEFWHKYETDSAKDGGYVEFSADSGRTWVNVIDVQSYYGLADASSDNFYTDTDTIQGGIPAFTGTRGSWQYSRFYIGWEYALMPTYHPGSERDFNFMTEKVMFRFHFSSDSIQTNKAGWIIDNITYNIYEIGGGISQQQRSFDVKLFPNPLEGQSILQIVDAGGGGSFTIRIYNATGQLISQNAIGKSGRYEINRNNMSSGIYLYSVSDRNGFAKTGRLIVR